MKKSFRVIATLVVFVGAICTQSDTASAALSYAGTDYNIGGTFFPGGAPPYVVVPWRSDSTPKAFDIDGNNVYGTDGYALFATQFTWPNAGCCGSVQNVNSATYPNLISLPSYVAGSQFLVNNKIGGWNYALVDDPTLVNGYRDFNWGNTLSPPVSPPNSQSPYVKIGNIEGNDILGNNARTGPNGAGRWAFTLGVDVPQTIRVSVMSDGYDGTNWSATEVLLARVSNVGAILDIVGSGALTRNRFIDMHTFDIVGGQPGENYAVFAKASGDGQGAIAGVSFDHIIPEPSGLLLLVSAAGTLTGCRRWRAK
jgi:hypothetical protein